MISGKDIQHIANLARLGFSEKELEKYQKELSLILGYIEKLKEVDVSKVEPTSHSIEVKNVVREDESQKSKGKNQKLLELAPETKDGYLKVKSILK